MNSSNSDFFPIFINLSQKNILLVGGGKIAKDKLEKLLYFRTNIKLVAKEITPELKQLLEKNSIKYEQRSYHDKDLETCDIVIVVADDKKLQKKIYHDSREKNILVNVADSKDECDFIFGSFIKEDDLIISISTGGNAPAVSKYLKQFLKKALPKGLNEFLSKMKKLRETLPKGKERMKLLDKEAKEFFT